MISTILGIFQGRQQAKSLKAQAAAARIEQEMALIRADQIAGEARSDLATALGNIDAIRSTRGASLDSQTGQAIGQRTMKDAYRAEAMARLAEVNRASTAGMAARGYRSAARWAIPLAAAQGMLQDAERVAALGGR